MADRLLSEMLVMVELRVSVLLLGSSWIFSNQSSVCPLVAMDISLVPHCNIFEYRYPRISECSGLGYMSERMVIVHLCSVARTRYLRRRDKAVH